MKHDLLFGDFIDSIIDSSKTIEKIIAYSDGVDIRTAQALDYFKDINKSRFVLVGDEKTIISNMKAAGIIKDDHFTIIDPKTSPQKDEYMDIMKRSFEKRGKEVSDEQLEKMAVDTSYYVSAMLKNNEADCAVGGSLSSTGALIKSVIHVLGLSEGRKFLSGAAFVDVPDCDYGYEGRFCLSDPAIIPKPTEDQLFDMTISSYETAKAVFGIEPRVALLSYSTNGSAKGKEIDRVANVVKRVQKSNPNMIVDGEIQFDAAIIPEVAKQKCPSSPLEGRANVLILPNLEAANICYKVIQRLAKATSCGTIVLGAAKPFNDLSRGGPYIEIVSLTAMTLLQTKGMEGK